MLIKIIGIPRNEIVISFFHASGPGGQNVNKAETAVRLRFDVRNSTSLTPEIKKGLDVIAGNRLRKDGVLEIEARRFRTQLQNRLDAENRLMRLIQQASVHPKHRQQTIPPKSAHFNRLDAKRKVSVKKLNRKKIDWD